MAEKRFKNQVFGAFYVYLEQVQFLKSELLHK